MEVSFGLVTELGGGAGDVGEGVLDVAWALGAVDGFGGEAEVLFEADAVNPVFAVALRNEFGVTAFAAHSELMYGDSGHFRAGQLATVKLRFDNWLGPARYGLVVSRGHISYDGDSGVIISGGVDRGGRVSVNLRYGESAAQGSGRLSRSDGAGRWHGASSGARCSGRWVAERRD